MSDDDTPFAVSTRPTGFYQHTPGNVDRVPAYDPRAAAHLWTVVVAYRVDPTRTGPGLLDNENLLQVDGPGCYYCEEPYTSRVASRRCPGQPKE